METQTLELLGSFSIKETNGQTPSSALDYLADSTHFQYILKVCMGKNNDFTLNAEGLLFLVKKSCFYKDILPTEEGSFYKSLRQVFETFSNKDLVEKVVRDNSYIIYPFLDDLKRQKIAYFFQEKNRLRFYIDDIKQESERLWSSRIFKRYVSYIKTSE